MVIRGAMESKPKRPPRVQWAWQDLYESSSQGSMLRWTMLLRTMIRSIRDSVDLDYVDLAFGGHAGLQPRVQAALAAGCLVGMDHTLCRGSIEHLLDGNECRLGVIDAAMGQLLVEVFHGVAHRLQPPTVAGSVAKVLPNSLACRNCVSHKRAIPPWIRLVRLGRAEAGASHIDTGSLGSRPGRRLRGLFVPGCVNYALLAASNQVPDAESEAGDA